MEVHLYESGENDYLVWGTYRGRTLGGFFFDRVSNPRLLKIIVENFLTSARPYLEQVVLAGGPGTRSTHFISYEEGASPEMALSELLAHFQERVRKKIYHSRKRYFQITCRGRAAFQARLKSLRQ